MYIEIVYHSTVSQVSRKYAMYKPATEGAGRQNGKID